MLIHRVDADTLAQAERLSAEVAARLAGARSTQFAGEGDAEAYLWGIIPLLQQQAAITARILMAAIDEREQSGRADKEPDD